ncbi:MAG: RNA polymerase sigma factor [Chloroflexi bacterium]|nr:RNA polymerase sigma factor [Chloroflexota bacterium]
MQQQGHMLTRSQDVPDSVLVGQILAGNQHAFETLVYRYSASLLGFIFHYLGNDDQASDVLQQVFLQLYLSLPILSTGGTLKPWLFRVAQNRCLDELRKRRRQRVSHFSELEWIVDGEDLSPLALIPDPHPLPEEIAEHHDLQHTLQSAIQRLPPKFRAVVLLRYSTQMSFSEIGQTLNMREATVKTYFQRARPLLRAVLTTQQQTAYVHPPQAYTLEKHLKVEN